MRGLSLILALSLWALAGASFAADQPRIAPPAVWVKPTPLPKPKGEDGGAYRFLLSDQQAEFGPDGDAFYYAYAIRLQTTNALTQAGSVALAWDPETEVPVVHKVHIVRGDAVIDVLAKQTFTVLRRETNLQFAQLDGRLTATLQIEGLQVGDILDVAYTLTRNDPAMKGRSNLILDWPKIAVDRAVVRALWSGPKAIQWRATGGMEPPAVSHKGAVTELVLDRQNVQASHQPRDAPARYRWGPQLELSEFKAWTEVSALMEPLYDQASGLKPDSPLKLEAAKIRAASSDPKTQAGAALALVQGQVRYLYLGMKDGGYVPANADLTWSRRFGDCKGKTVLLLALLKELGIEAEPALVSTVAGDGLDARLPTMGLFDHVILRVVVGGKVYWLDGTRTNDRGLDALRIPDWQWSLPERPAGAQLVKLEPPPLERPEFVSDVRLDASAGLDAPAKIHVEQLIRGDAGRFMHVAFAGMAATDRDKALREAWEKSYPGLVISAMSEALDDKTGEFRMIVDGKAPLEWKPPGAANYRFLTILGAGLGWTPDYKRDPGPMADAPFAARCGAYSELRETIVLPRGGVGFSAPAPDVDEKVAGCSLYRRSRLENGVFTLLRTERQIAKEFPAAEATAAAAKLGDLAKVVVYVRTPPVFTPTDADIVALAAKEPTTAHGYIERGNGYNQRRDYDKAMADFNKAMALDPKESYALSNRGISHYWKGELDLAKADFQAAAKLNARDVVAVHGQGLLARRAYRYDEAIAAFSRAIDLKVDNAFALDARASIYEAQGQFDKAIADFDEMQRIMPGNGQVHIRKTLALRAMGDRKAALAEAELAMKDDPRDDYAPLLHAGLRAEMGEAARALAEFDSAIASHATVNGYLTRAKYREKADRAGRLADINAALKLEPNAVQALAMQAEWRTEAGAHDQAIAGLTDALKAQPNATSLLASRARAYARAGDLKSADRDLIEVSRKSAANPQQLNSACWLRATLGVAVQQALVDCDHALAISPTFPEALDSRAFALLRLGRLDEAVATYDAALTLRPKQAASLYGRGLAKLGLQHKAEGEADLAAAMATAPKIAEDFAGWGMPRPANSS